MSSAAQTEFDPTTIIEGKTVPGRGALGAPYISFDGFLKNQSPLIGKLVAALAKSQLGFGEIIKDQHNPYYDSYYADLSGVIKATQPSLAANELVIVTDFESDTQDKEITITSTLYHSSDQWKSNTLVLPATSMGKDKVLRHDAQSVSSAVTYARRIGYQALVGVAAEQDDDGNTASGKEKQTRPELSQQQRVATPSSQGQSRPANSTPTRTAPTETKKDPPASEYISHSISENEKKSQPTNQPTSEEFTGYMAKIRTLANDLSAAGLAASKNNTINAKISRYILNATGTSDPQFKEISKEKWDMFLGLVEKIQAGEGGTKELVGLVEAAQ